MNTLTTGLTLTAILILGGAVAPQKPPTPMHPGGPQGREEKKPVAEVGEAAPLFELKDQFGKTHKLKDYEGTIVVLEWFNETCPYCVGIWESGLIKKLSGELTSFDTPVVYLAMNSTANRPEEDVLKTGKEFIEDNKLEIPMLMDYDGKVGRAYAAKTTPHMYVIDAEGVLAYQGAISDDPRGKEGVDAQTHVMNAVTQLIKGDDVSTSYVKPWGCSVKYAKKDGNREGRGQRGPRRGPKDPRN